MIGAAADIMLATDAGRAVAARYDEPWRRYHARPHLQAMVAHLADAERAGVPVVDPVACAGFVLWHDAIYDPQAASGRNEALSALLAEAEMPTVAPPASVARAAVAIRATATHRMGEGHSPDLPLLLDVDLAILGAASPAFDAYDRAIREEYAHVPDEAYAAGRSRLLSAFLARDRLFLTDWGMAKWDAAARRNLRQAIARLADQVRS